MLLHVLPSDPSQPVAFPPRVAPFCFLSFVGVCMFVLDGHMSVWVHTCVRTGAGYLWRPVFLIFSPSYWLETGSSDEREFIGLGWSASKLLESACLYTPCPNPRMEIQAGVAIHLGLFCGHWRFKLWSSCWQIQLTNWIVSSVPTSCFLIGCAALPDIFPLLSGSPPPLFSTKRWWNLPAKRPSHGLCQHAASWIYKEYSPASVSPPGSQHSHPSELLNRSKFKISQKSEIEYLHTAHMHLHVLLAYLICLRQGLTL